MSAIMKRSAEGHLKKSKSVAGTSLGSDAASPVPTKTQCCSPTSVSSSQMEAWKSIGAGIHKGLL